MIDLLISPAELSAEINRQFPETPFDIRLGEEQIRMPEALTRRNFSISGRGGRVWATMAFLQQLRAMPNQKCLIVDVDGFYYDRFGRPGDKILSLDRPSERWDFYNERVSPDFIANTLIEQSFYERPYRVKATAVAFLADLLEVNSSIDDLWRDLNLEVKYLLPKLQNASPELPNDPGLYSALQSVRATVVQELNFLQQLVSKNKDQGFFNLTDWATSSNSNWVFLVANKINLASINPLLHLWFSIATLGVMNRNGNELHLWLVADNLFMLSKLPLLAELLTQSHLHNASVIAGWHSAEQLEVLYGVEAEAIFCGFQNKLQLMSTENSLPLQFCLKLTGFNPTQIHRF